MSADGSIGELKRLLSTKCGLSISKVGLQLIFIISKLNIYSDVSI